MNERRNKLIEVFKDTLRQINEDEDLLDSCDESRRNTIFYPADKYFDLKDSKIKKGEVFVNEYNTFQDASRLHKLYPNKKICVLNFASATNPGGYVRGGSSAQEESLCRCSTLYTVINVRYLYTKYYEPNKEKDDPLYSDALVYTPNIKVIKNDEDYSTRLDKKDYFDVDVITCAAPNLRDIEISDKELYDLHLSRAKHILNIAAYHDADIIILGAFGCGAFKNNPNVVASAYKEVLKEYRKYFDIVDFAVYHREYEIDNYLAFKSIL